MISCTRAFSHAPTLTFSVPLPPGFRHRISSPDFPSRLSLLPPLTPALQVSFILSLTAVGSPVSFCYPLLPSFQSQVSSYPTADLNPESSGLLGS